MTHSKRKQKNCGITLSLKERREVFLAVVNQVEIVAGYSRSGQLASFFPIQCVHFSVVHLSHCLIIVFLFSILRRVLP